MITIENIKLYLAILATVITIWAYYPYFRDVFNRSSQPHIYTWLIWAITQITATLGLFYGGGGYGVIPIFISMVLTCAMAITCIKYGTKNITKQDTISLVLAMFILPIWLLTNNPYLAVFMATVIDGIGYFPTFRKTWKDPESETPSFWFGMSSASFLNSLSNANYNFLTITYITTIGVLNILVYTVCIFRKKS